MYIYLNCDKDRTLTKILKQLWHELPCCSYLAAISCTIGLSDIDKKFMYKHHWNFDLTYFSKECVYGNEYSFRP